MKIRPCRQQICFDLEPCPYPAMKGKQSCEWHWLMKQPAHVQRHSAERRRALSEEAGQDLRARVPSSEWPAGERWCAGCQSFVPLFYCAGSRCKSCASSAAHGARVETTYGISPERYDQLFELQGRRCAICRSRPRSMRLAVDHDHRTGEPRGLLCKRCNHDLLGSGHDDIKFLYRAIAYLLFPPAKYPVRPTVGQVLPALQHHLAIGILRDATPSDGGPPPF